MSAIASEHILKKAAQSFPQAVAYATATMCFSIFSVGTLFGYNMSQSFSVLSQPDVVRDQTSATFRGEYQQARKHHPKAPHSNHVDQWNNCKFSGRAFQE
jgi:hypothetical protein